MNKRLTRGKVLGLFLLTGLCVFMGVKIASVFTLRSSDSAFDNGAIALGAGVDIHEEGAPVTIQIAAPAVTIVTDTNTITPAWMHDGAFYPRFPLEQAATPIVADPWDMLHWPRAQWRDSRFELFSWDRYPEILIIDLATLAIQEQFFHRLAFFVEKAGFRGRLSHDHEIGHLHGWNAHNYRDYDLARFFRIARETDFPLLPEEWELEAILMRHGVITLDSEGRIIPGRGAILTLTQESVPILRTRFMVHEVFHGLYFIDEDFREFSRQRWEIFPEFARNFLLAFFALQEYDIEYEFLVINEFMGHLLQLPVAQASWFFAQHTANRLWREGLGHVLPERYEIRDGVRFWPELASVFTAETQVFSDHVYERWGLEAGRVWRPR